MKKMSTNEIIIYCISAAFAITLITAVCIGALKDRDNL